ncbi:MAG: VOC family protein [Deinococcota bacterium]
MIYGFDHVAIAVSDIPMAIKFYEKILDMHPVDQRDPKTASFFWLKAGAGQSLNLCLAADKTPRARGDVLDWDTTPHIAFVCDQSFLDTVQKRLSNSGIVHQGNASSLYFTDPDGNFIELTCWREQRLKTSGAAHW